MVKNILDGSCNLIPKQTQKNNTIIQSCQYTYPMGSVPPHDNWQILNFYRGIFQIYKFYN